MKIGNYIKAYQDFRRDMHGLPNSSPLKKIIRRRMSDFLQEIKDNFGQDIVDLIVKHPRTLNMSQEEKLAIVRKVMDL